MKLQSPSTVEQRILGYPIPSYRVWYIWYRHMINWRKYIAASLVSNIGEMVFTLLALGLGLMKYIGNINGIPYVEFLAPGIWMSAAMNTAAFECTFGTYTRYHEQKTFDAMLAAPIQLEEIIAGEVSYGATRGVVSSIIIFAIFLIFGLIKSPWALLIIPVAVLTSIAFSTLSLICSAIAKSYDYFSYYFTVVITPMFFFSGIFFPLDQLPSWAEKLAWFTPLYHGVRIAQSLFHGAPDWETLASISISIIWLIVFSAVTFYVSTRAFRKRILK